MNTRQMRFAPATVRVSFIRRMVGLAVSVACIFWTSVAGAAVTAGLGDDITIAAGTTVSNGPSTYAISATAGGQVTGDSITAISTNTTASGWVVYASGAGSAVTLNAPGSSITGRYVGAWMDSGA